MTKVRRSEKRCDTCRGVLLDDWSRKKRFYLKRTHYTVSKRAVTHMQLVKPRFNTRTLDRRFGLMLYQCWLHCYQPITIKCAITRAYKFKQTSIYIASPCSNANHSSQYIYNDKLAQARLWSLSDKAYPPWQHFAYFALLHSAVNACIGITDL